ncbi:hypothetical protein HBI56_150120 [Parastagonospora nodorum]|nr:hypothetical protein HBH56_184400 [Parastagonospora nodorum]KAH3925985.1 hypothetical protein HBH54_173550 [Parastagonospora nodorum]KAH3944804.1 hypothetical protein HBH53_151380 [Parastagonospora nodorum]KAH3962416.1 hypothetical protein HBH52_225030 [Parastagonospora nodorum]KAH3965034.1 hypothetical protein HBH51_156010 [Parastagonospora nodorum]
MHPKLSLTWRVGRPSLRDEAAWMKQLDAISLARHDPWAACLGCRTCFCTTLSHWLLHPACTSVRRFTSFPALSSSPPLDYSATNDSRVCQRVLVCLHAACSAGKRSPDAVAERSKCAIARACRVPSMRTVPRTWVAAWL